MILRFTAAALALAVAAPIAALAQSATAPAGGALAACQADIQKLCASATGRERGKCLRDNAASLSDGCKTTLAALRESREKVRAACAEDIATLCKSDSSGEDGRPMRCLKDNEAKLSAGCKTAFSTMGNLDASPAAKP